MAGMAGEDDKKRRWFYFSIKDLLAVTFIVAVASAFIESLERIWPTGDRWLHLFSYVVVFGAAFGVMSRQFRGGLIGMIIGTCIAIGGWFCVHVYPRL